MKDKNFCTCNGTFLRLPSLWTQKKNKNVSPTQKILTNAKKFHTRKMSHKREKVSTVREGFTAEEKFLKNSKHFLIGKSIINNKHF